MIWLRQLMANPNTESKNFSHHCSSGRWKPTCSQQLFFVSTLYTYKSKSKKQIIKRESNGHSPLCFFFNILNTLIPTLSELKTWFLIPLLSSISPKASLQIFWGSISVKDSKRIKQYAIERTAKVFNMKEDNNLTRCRHSQSSTCLEDTQIRKPCYDLQ